MLIFVDFMFRSRGIDVGFIIILAVLVMKSKAPEGSSEQDI